jgi:hypothetical protein
MKACGQADAAGRKRPGQLVVVSGVVLVLVGMMLRGMERLGWLPGVERAANPDETILVVQHRAGHSMDPADLILVGDSSCLTGVDPVQLATHLPGRPVPLNLGLVITLPLSTYAELAGVFAERNAGTLRWVVLLVTPAKLGSTEFSEGHLSTWRGLGMGEDGLQLTDPIHPALSVLGVDVIRRRLLPHFAQRPLGGSGAVHYGFPTGVAAHLVRHRGSIIDHGVYRPERRPSRTAFSLDSGLEEPSRAFRRLLPPNMRLAAGLTPLPESHVGREHRRRQVELLEEWNEWLGADLLLTELPARLPDGLFASGAHLNAKGQQVYARLLGRALVSATGRE